MGDAEHRRSLRGVYKHARLRRLAVIRSKENGYREERPYIGVALIRPECDHIPSATRFGHCVKCGEQVAWDSVAQPG